MLSLKNYFIKLIKKQKSPFILYKRKRYYKKIETINNPPSGQKPMKKWIYFRKKIKKSIGLEGENHRCYVLHTKLAKVERQKFTTVDE